MSITSSSNEHATFPPVAYHNRSSALTFKGSQEIKNLKTRVVSSPLTPTDFQQIFTDLAEIAGAIVVKDYTFAIVEWKEISCSLGKF